MPINKRLVATKVLFRVVKNGVSLKVSLEQIFPKLTQERDMAFVQAICYGVMRWYLQLDFILAKLLHKPIKDLEIKLLLLVGIYQLNYMRVKDYAAVSETVAAVPKKKSWAQPFINAILRKFLQKQQSINASLNTVATSAHAHPQWLLALFKDDWPNQYSQLLDANNQLPPMALRINIQRCTRESYAQKLKERGLSSHKHPYCPSALVLERAIATEKLPGFAEGWVFIQDGAAQLAAELLDVHPKHKVLDLCAAPGGKTTHILEQQPKLASLTAVDINYKRLQLVADNLQRLRLTADLLVGDARYCNKWCDEKFYDRILLDAPCSATGVIRRHPEIKMLRKPEDIAQLVTLQQQILQSSWGLLKSGGMLLYATCSVLQQENEKQIQRFIANNADAKIKKINANWGHQQQYGRQILTGNQEEMDGFYYACINKL